MTNVSDILGVGPSIEFEGITYHVKPLTFELQAKFEQWLRRRAIRAAQEDHAAKVLSPEEYHAALGRIDKDWAAGEYAYGSETSRKASMSPPGVKELLRLSLSKDHQEVDAAFVDRLFEAELAAVIRAMNEANTDPLPKKTPKDSASR